MPIRVGKCAWAYYLKSPTEHRKHRKPTLAQQRMLTVYLELLRSLIWALPLTPQEDLTIACDRFQGGQTLLSAVETLLAERGNGTLTFEDSATQKPLQLADLLVGTLRRHLAGDSHEGRFRFVAPITSPRGCFR